MKRSLLIGALVGALALFASSCNSQGQSVLDHVTFTASPSLDTVSVTMFFSNSVQSNVSSDYQVKTYGDIFLNANTATTPMEIGFNLNTAIFNDQQYVTLSETQSFPNGQPIGLTYPVVQITPDKPVSSTFNIYGYVDVLHGEWVGGAAIFNFINQSFPAGLAISQVFDRDSSGNPEITGTVFGPSLNTNGTIKTPGGISVFANVQSLMGTKKIQAGKSVSFYPEKGVLVAGPQADELRKDEKALKHLQDLVISGLNNLR